MSTHKRIDLICVVVLVIAIAVTILFMNGEKLGLRVETEEEKEEAAAEETGSVTAAEITLDGSGGTVSGSGAYFSDGDLIIAAAGSYTLSGTLSNGSIIVNTDTSSRVTLVLEGVSVFCEDDACIRVNEAKRVILTLADGTENTLESGSSYSEEALLDKTDGVIFSHQDMTINGTGALTITGGYKHGIAANDKLKITDCTITVDAVSDAIHAGSNLKISGAAITATAGEAGLKSKEGSIEIESGSFTLTTTGDAIHAAEEITILGGSFELSSQDDGIHSDKSVTIEDGTILITDCYEGIEGITVTVSGGDISIYCSDDGINASEGGSGDGIRMGNFHVYIYSGYDHDDDEEEEEEEDAEEEEDLTPNVTISGGTISIINSTGTDADGIDSNGDIVISGGEIFISLTANGSNCPLDYGSENSGVCRIDGGTVIACGSSSMVERMSNDSKQASILFVDAAAEAGSVASLTDEDGNVLLSREIPLTYSAILFSCPEMETGKTYTLSMGGTDTEIEVTQNAMLVYGPNKLSSGTTGTGKGTHSSSDTDTQTDTTDSTAADDNAAEAQAPQAGEQPGTDGNTGEMPEMPDGDFDPGQTGDGTAPTKPDDDFDPNQADAGDGTAMTPPDGDFDPNQADAGDGAAMTPPDGDFDPNQADAGDGTAPEMPEDASDPNRADTADEAAPDASADDDTAEQTDSDVVRPRPGSGQTTQPRAHLTASGTMEEPAEEDETSDTTEEESLTGSSLKDTLISLIPYVILLAAGLTCVIVYKKKA